MARRTIIAALALTWAVTSADPARGAPRETASEAGPTVADVTEETPPLTELEDAWLRHLNPGEGEAQPVYFELGGRRIHAFNLPSLWADAPEVRVEQVGHMVVVIAYLWEETRLGVSLHDRTTGTALGQPLIVEGEGFIEELGCGGLIALNDLAVVLDGEDVRIAMRFAIPILDENDARALVFDEPGLPGRMRALPPPVGARLHVMERAQASR
jgi:hypothetical protein